MTHPSSTLVNEDKKDFWHITESHLPPFPEPRPHTSTLPQTHPHTLAPLLPQQRQDLECGCENASVVFLRPHSTSEMRGRLQMLEKNYQLMTVPQIDSAFYFDFAVRGLKAAR